MTRIDLLALSHLPLPHPLSPPHPWTDIEMRAFTGENEWYFA